MFVSAQDTDGDAFLELTDLILQNVFKFTYGKGRTIMKLVNELREGENNSEMVG